MKESEDVVIQPTEEDEGSQQMKKDLIQTTRDFVRQFGEEERLEMARGHVVNALRYKEPRFDIINSREKTCYMGVYQWQTSKAWEMCMGFLSFVYMYLIVFEKTQYRPVFLVASPVVFGIFVVDFAMQTYHECFDEFRRKARFDRVFKAKLVAGTLLFVDEILLALELEAGGRMIHPFFIVRVALPILYNREVLRAFMALGSAYKDIFLCFVFYFAMIVIFAIVGSRIIETDPAVTLDPYVNNYRNLGRMVFIVYVLGTYDAYPDNQLPAIESNIYYYGFFILFIFLNMFIFSSIPGSIVFDRFRETRGRLQLLDEIKMQNSLIVAFITIGEENYQMEVQRLIKFLLYFYENRVRFIDVVTSICLKLNPNDHTSLDVNEFMQLGRILQENSNLRPPPLSDAECWVGFRRYVQREWALKNKMQSTCYRLVSALVALLAFVNAVLFLSSSEQAYWVVDLIFTNLFLLELALELIAVGPENYFSETLSGVDFFMAVLGFFVQFFGGFARHGALLRVLRVYRAGFLFQVAAQNRCWKLNIQFYRNFQNLVKRMAVILPIIFKLLPIFLIVIYSLGVIGMEALKEAYDRPASPDNIYDKYSNFADFIDSQFYFFQVLTEAGWSAVAYDVASRVSEWFGAIMLLFAFYHVVVVLLLATLVKGIVLSTFMSVTNQEEVMQEEQSAESEHAKRVKLKFDELKMLNEIVEQLESLKLDSLVKRDLYESKMNQLLMVKLQRVHKHKKLARNSVKGANMESSLYRNFNVNRLLLEEEELARRKQDEASQFIFSMLAKFSKERMEEETYDLFLDKEDYEKQIQKLCGKMKMLTEIKVSPEIIPNPLLVEHLKAKTKTPFSLQQSQSQEQQLSTELFDMHILLGIEATWREQKAVVIRGLKNRGVVDPASGKELLHKRLGEKNFKLDEDCTLRKTYLQGTKPQLVAKFEAEYFADLYGKAFKEINKVTIEPLIKLESTVVYALKNICRYPHMKMGEFFRILTKIENIISNQLLKRGSLFKFVFQLNCEKEIWFSVELDGLAKPHISFLKNNTWLHHPGLTQQEIYHVPDLFKFDRQAVKGGLLQRAQTVKQLYQTFESLALTLEEKEVFFESNPQYHVYDSYFTFKNVQSVQRLIQRELEVSRIMIVLLTKEKQRTSLDEMPFQVSEIPIEKLESQVKFRLDETESETYKKLSHLAGMNEQEASAREGLPFNYVVNFLLELEDILKIHSPNFLYHVENLLNREINEAK